MKYLNFFNKLILSYTDNSYTIFLRYILSGIFVTIINFLLLFVFIEWFYINYIFSNIISMIICIILTYFISKKIVFMKKVKIGRKKEFISYVLIALLSIVIDTFILFLLTKFLMLYYIFSKIISTFISTFINFYLKKKIYERYKC